MKIYEASLISFVLSLLTGVFVFFGIAFVWGFTSEVAPKDFFNSDGAFVALVFYIIYGIIQFFLSLVNVVQAIMLSKQGRLLEEEEGFHDFYKAEMALYFVVFILLALITREMEPVPFILIGSIPYALCCTGSILFFRYLLSGMNAPLSPAPQNQAQDETV